MSEKLYLLVAQSAKCTIMAELQLRQSIIFLGTEEKLLSLSPLLVIAHSNYTGLLNCSSFFIRVQGWRIFDNEFISFDMLNGQRFTDVFISAQ